jgi:hypothetical protein
MRCSARGEIVDCRPDHAGHGDGILNELASFLVVKKGAGNEDFVSASGLCGGWRGTCHLSLPLEVRGDYEKRVRLGLNCLPIIGERL